MPKRNLITKQPSMSLGKYRHYKGGEYEVLSLAVNEATHEWCVVYRTLYDTGKNPKTWIRTVEDFSATLDNGQKRFEKV